MATLPPFPSFDLSTDHGALGTRWKKYVSRFRNLLVALNITNKKRQRAILLHYAGEEVNDIVDTLPDAEAEGDEDPLESLIIAVTNHFTPKSNVAYEEYKFRQAKQESGEDIMTYYTRLKHLAQTCEFADTDREIKSQIVQLCSSTKLRRKALSDPSISLQALLDYGKTLELTETQVKDLKNSKEGVNKVGKKHETYLQKSKNGPQHRGRHCPRNGPSGTSLGATKCRNCGGTYPHNGGVTGCPAYQKDCRNCGKLGHFKSVCRSKPKARARQQESGKTVMTLDEYLGGLSFSDDENAFYLSINSVHDTNTKNPMFKVQINGTWLTLMADSGSSVNILDEHDFNSLKSRPRLSDTTTRVYPYKFKTPLKMLGKSAATIITKTGITSQETICVAEGTGGSLLSWQTSQNLGLISVTSPLARKSSPKVEQLVKNTMTSSPVLES